jgi:hypothetical protein
VSESAKSPGRPPAALLEVMSNLSRFHREHEKFYSQAPLRQAADVQAASRALKALAAQWGEATATEHPLPNPYAGAEDLNPPGLVAESGILFMEGEGEPVEIARLKRDLGGVAADCEAAGSWLTEAMEHSWQVAGALIPYAELADLLGERHRIIANDWQAAASSALAGRLMRRAIELLDAVDFTPEALRADLDGPRNSPRYLTSASELLDRASDLLAESATLVHDNERRWRVFGRRVAELSAGAEE